MRKLCLTCLGEGMVFTDGSNSEKYAGEYCPNCGGEGTIDFCAKSNNGFHEYKLEGSYSFSQGEVSDDIVESDCCMFCGEEKNMVLVR